MRRLSDGCRDLITSRIGGFDLTSLACQKRSLWGETSPCADRHAAASVARPAAPVCVLEASMKLWAGASPGVRSGKTRNGLACTVDVQCAGKWRVVAYQL